MITNIEREREKRGGKEREGRTAIHDGDFIRIPFWEISVERRGIREHYKKRYQMKSSSKGKIDKYKCVWCLTFRILY